MSTDAQPYYVDHLADPLFPQEGSWRVIFRPRNWPQVIFRHGVTAEGYAKAHEAAIARCHELNRNVQEVNQ